MDRSLSQKQRGFHLLIMVGITLVWLYVLFVFFFVGSDVVSVIKEENVPFSFLGLIYVLLLFATPFSIPVSLFLMWFKYWKKEIWDALLWGALPLAVGLFSSGTLYTLYTFF